MKSRIVLLEAHVAGDLLDTPWSANVTIREVNVFIPINLQVFTPIAFSSHYIRIGLHKGTVKIKASILLTDIKVGGSRYA